MELKQSFKIGLFINSSLRLGIEASNEKIKKISAISLKNIPCLEAKCIEESGEFPEILKICCLELDKYFKGKLTSFSFLDQLDLVGTPFQLRIYKELLKIPWGETINYEELAKRIGNPRSCRAAGSACGTNRFLVVVPCHRIISKNGTIGGFSGDINIKKNLLELEGGSKKLKNIFMN